MILEILAFSSCDRSKGDPGEVGPIKFRIHDRDDHPLYVVTTAHDLPGALRLLADALEEAGPILQALAPYQATTTLEGLGDGDAAASFTRARDLLESLPAALSPTLATARTRAELERMAALVDLDPFR